MTVEDKGYIVTSDNYPGFSAFSVASALAILKDIRRENQKRKSVRYIYFIYILKSRD